MSSHHYPFGSVNPSRNYNSSDYRYGFNGKENDKTINEGAQDYGMRINDVRLGRFFSVDPITKQYPELTPYQFASNTPIQAIDLDGLEAFFVGGTWQASTSIGFNAWGNTTMRSFIGLTGNKTFEHLHWSGNNNSFARKIDAYIIARQVYEKTLANPGYEPVILIGHSHGGNVMIEAANILKREYGITIDALFTVNTPVIKQHQLDPSLVKKITHVNIFNFTDKIQVLGGDDFTIPEGNDAMQQLGSQLGAKYKVGESEISGDIGKSGQMFPNAINIPYTHQTGVLDGDYGFHMGNWNKNAKIWLNILQSTCMPSQPKISTVPMAIPTGGSTATPMKTFSTPKASF